MKILVTGGTGYIGSHTTVELLKAGHEVEILDNLFNSKITVLDKIEKLTGVKPNFYQVDLLDYPKMLEIFEAENYDAVIHFAGLKAVAESVEQPVRYYENNITGTLNLLKAMQKTGVNKIIFSSSATVYGDAGTRLAEDAPTGHGITNPYGQTKFMIEQILQDVCKASAIACQSGASASTSAPANSTKAFAKNSAKPEPFRATILRYFNPIGAHASGLLGEDPNGIPNNLMPIVMKVATGEIPELSVYGDDYPTEDGTAKRDYIHVVDLAKGHLAALDKMTEAAQVSPNSPVKTSAEIAKAKTVEAESVKTDFVEPEPAEGNCAVYNLGTGRATSVLEMVKAFETAAGRPLPYKIVDRRPGDLPELCADPSKAERELGWRAELTVADAMRDTLNYLQNLK